MNSFAFVKLICLLLLITVAVIDFRQRKFKNHIFLLMLLAGSSFLILTASPYGIGWLQSLLGFVFAFCAFIFFYKLRWMGAGDVKFAAALGFWLGISSGFLFSFIGASLAAMLHAILVMNWASITLAMNEWSKWIKIPTKVGAIYKRIPYAGYMAVAAIAWILGGAENVVYV